MIKPDSVLQSIVDKLFPEAIEADYEAEQAFYTKRNLPLPDHLKDRNLRLAARGSDDLDLSIAAASESDSELPSEPPSVNASIMAPDNGPDTKDALPSSVDPSKPSDMDTNNDFQALDRKIEEVLSTSAPLTQVEAPALPSGQNQMDLS